MALRRLSPALVCLLALPACDSTEPSELGLWSVRADLRNNLEGYGQPAHVVVGSEFYFELVRYADGEGGQLDVSPDVAECVPTTGTGSVSGSAGVMQVDGEGPGTIEIPAPLDACPDLTGATALLTADRWAVVGVDPADTEVRWSLWFEQGLGTASPGPGSPFPSELGVALDSILVAEGGRFQVDPALVYAPAGEQTEVRWSGHDAEISNADESLLRLYDPSDATSTILFGSIDAGETVAANFRVGDWTAPAPTITGVSTNDITTLELVPVYGSGDTEREWSEPIGVIALAHDADGNRVVAPPVEWSKTEGTLGVRAPASSEVSDVLYTDDICVARPSEPEQRTATIEARLGELVATAELEWTALVDGPEPDLDSAVCGDQGCQCSAAAEPQGLVWGLLGLIGVGLVRRRRARS